MSRLIFVYNAHSGWWNTVLDTVHKTVSPNTYQCDLCQLTYGAFSEREEWKAFRESFPGDLVFLHIDEFERKYPVQAAYPVVLEETPDGNLSVLISAEDFIGFSDAEELIAWFNRWLLEKT